MGSEHGSGERRLSNYADSVISSHIVTDEIDIDVPVDAYHYITEGGDGRYLVTFYRWESRHDLDPVPEDWRGKRIRFSL